ncbi:hypothetical protein EDD37DRAFT_511796 [Exophiala viscosa]|uniref:Glutaminase n=1 Tax=Exophiala viscosa TaxID=2486360 RepID=A0AAN6IEP6_9EURO|nr:hypothetical protein EDD36DRAFT_380435 [Exophiala viscosa]KAI1622242.1 hypothetical protein EDD37DRAFT_511796 [Exophiala viscosa]
MLIKAPAVPSHDGPPSDAEISPQRWAYGTIEGDSVEIKSRTKSGRHGHSRLLAFGSLLLVSVFIWYGFVSQRGSWQPLLPSVPAEHQLHISPILPPSYPLAVRSPYLSAWLPSSHLSSMPTSHAEFWQGAPLGWSVAVRVNGTAYSLFGNPGIGRPAVLNNAEYTVTHSIFNFSAGLAMVSLDFFSPVSPHNLLRQSLPFSYLTVSVTLPSSGQIQVYSDIDAAWTGPESAQYSYFASAKDTEYFEVSPVWPKPFREERDRPLWGQAVYGTRPEGNATLTSQVGEASLVRNRFANHGNLNRVHDVWKDHGSVLGFSHDLGTIQEPTSVTFAIGHHRVESINYVGQVRTGYYRATYPDVASALVHFLDDYDDAYAEAAEMDSDIVDKAANISQHYADIIALSVRQSFGAVEITIPESDHDVTDTMAFIKEISSDGNVNTLDIIFPTFPIYYVTNPDFIKFQLEPILRYLQAGRWPHEWAIHDIGASYPVADGHDRGDAEQMPLEESGNILLLVYAYQVASGNTTWAKQYQHILKGYATYLSEHGWYPEFQLASSDAAGPAVNQTNLAIKSAVGMVAYGKLFSDDFFVANGTALAEAIYGSGLGTDANKSHFVLSYNDDDTWSGCYNMFSDKLFGFNLFPKAAYEMQSAWLRREARLDAGVPLDSRVTWSKSDWNMFLASISSHDVAGQYIDDLHAYASNGLNAVPFSDRYWVDGSATGHFFDIRNRPTVGGHFAPVAMLHGPKLF